VTNLEIIGVLKDLVTHFAGTVSFCPEFMVAKLIVVIESEVAFGAPAMSACLLAMFKECFRRVEGSVAVLALIFSIELVHYDARHVDEECAGLARTVDGFSLSPSGERKQTLARNQRQ